MNVYCRTVAFSPCGKHIISGSQMGKINFFNTETGQREQQLDTRGKYTLSIAYVRIAYLSASQNLADIQS